jgi:hypothetical protein
MKNRMDDPNNTVWASNLFGWIKTFLMPIRPSLHSGLVRENLSGNPFDPLALGVFGIGVPETDFLRIGF